MVRPADSGSERRGSHSGCPRGGRPGPDTPPNTVNGPVRSAPGAPQWPVATDGTGAARCGHAPLRRRSHSRSYRQIARCETADSRPTAPRSRGAMGPVRPLTLAPAPRVARSDPPGAPRVRLRACVIPHGGDYNPEHWPESVREDYRDLVVPAGCNVDTLRVFGWASLEPEARCFTFGLVVDENGIRRRHGNRHAWRLALARPPPPRRATGPHAAGALRPTPGSGPLAPGQRARQPPLVRQVRGAFRGRLQWRHESLDALSLRCHLHCECAPPVPDVRCRRAPREKGRGALRPRPARAAGADSPLCSCEWADGRACPVLFEGSSITWCSCEWADGRAPVRRRAWQRSAVPKVSLTCSPAGEGTAAPAGSAGYRGRRRPRALGGSRCIDPTMPRAGALMRTESGTGGDPEVRGARSVAARPWAPPRR